jgi:pre-mRNA-processing factor SLU7
MLMSNLNLNLQDVSLPKSKYEEDVFINNHTSVWGSWWKDHQWGYKCCKQTIKNSYCTGLAGIEAAEASADLMKANMARKEAAEGILSRKHFYLLFIYLDNLHFV